MRLPLSHMLVLGLSLGAGHTLALEPKEFEAPSGLTDAELERMKAKSKSDMVDYGKDVSVNTAPFPWAAAILGLLVLAGVAPFAWMAYRNAAQELTERNANQAPPRGPRPLDD